MPTVAVLNALGNAFAVFCGAYGDVLGQAQQQGCSRQTIYNRAGKVEQAISTAFQLSPSSSALMAENQRLRQENLRLGQQLQQQQQLPEQAIVLDKALQQ